MSPKPRSTDRCLVRSLACFRGRGLVLGVFFLPLACSAACPGFLFGNAGSDGFGAVGVLTGSGLVRPLWRAGRRRH
jgi:hypothetical protein